VKLDTKKQTADPAIDLLLEHADELVDCLRCLKSEGSQRGGQSDAAIALGAASSRERLVKLSATLLPAFQAIASKTSEKTPVAVSGPQIQSGLALPPPTIVTKWTPADIPKLPPPVPKVLDPQIEKAALTHMGQHLLGINYERLEWLGDAYLEVIATAIIHYTFPHLPEGRCAQMRELMVRNLTLSEFTVACGLDKRASLPEEFSEGGRQGGTTASEKGRVKALGDLFEAYVGAVILSDPQTGLKRVSDWLKALWSPILEQQTKHHRGGPPSEINEKTKLDQLIGGRHIKIEYRDRPVQKKDKAFGKALFAVSCILHGWGESGKELGFGTGLNKKEAGNKAAQNAMANKKLLKPYIEKRAVYLAAQRAQQEQEAAQQAPAQQGQETQS